MRLALALASLLPIAALAGCGASEEAARNTFRQSSIDSCLSAARQKGGAATAGIDWQRMCTCVTDKLMAGKTARDLLQMQPGGPESRDAAAQCLAEVGFGAPPAPAAGAGGDKPST